MDFRYPKDAEKHLLAVKSGLTRSQVLAPYYKLTSCLGHLQSDMKNVGFNFNSVNVKIFYTIIQSCIVTLLKMFGSCNNYVKS